MTATILLVDDDPVLSELVSYILKAEGYEAVVANDGEDGLRKFQTVKPDLVVLDVTMPNLDGPGMLAKMREAGNKTPVLMLTSESKKSIMVDVMKAGIEDYILKPFKPEELKGPPSRPPSTSPR